jgi:DNA-binding CsgD family transcriptional regulator
MVASGRRYVHPTRGAAFLHLEGGAGAPGRPEGQLSERELEVLRGATGHTNAEITAALHISVRTVESHRAHIQRKLGDAGPTGHDYRIRAVGRGQPRRRPARHAAGPAAGGARPDFVIGTSVGAVNGAWVAGYPDAGGADRLASVWRGLRRAHVFPSSPLRALTAADGRSREAVSPHGLRGLLTGHIPFRLLEDAPVPLHVVVADVLTGQDVLLSAGPAVGAVMASGAAWADGSDQSAACRGLLPLP